VESISSILRRDAITQRNEQRKDKEWQAAEQKEEASRGELTSSLENFVNLRFIEELWVLRFSAFLQSEVRTKNKEVIMLQKERSPQLGTLAPNSESNFSTQKPCALPV